MKRSLVHALIAAALAAGAHAGLFDEISKAADKIKQANDAVQQGSSAVQQSGSTAGSVTPSSADTNPTPSRSTLAGGSYHLPFNMPVYPNAKLHKRVDNPFDRVTIPVSIPVEGPDGYLAPDSVPIEGRVTMLQYQHRSDDSPILIQHHYVEWLASQGFEQIEVCGRPCKPASSYSRWALVDDASNHIDSSYLPDKPSYIAAYKPGAMILVGVGEDGDHFASYVKVVEGKIIEPAIWERAKKTHKVTGGVVASNDAPGKGTPAPGNPPVTPGKPGSGPASFADGAELVPKLSSLKLLAGPSKDAKVVATLSVGDGLVYMGTENGGYLQVTTSQGDGWVDHRLVRQQ